MEFHINFILHESLLCATLLHEYFTCITILSPASHNSKSFLLIPSFSDEENEAQRGLVTCLKV